MKEELIKQISAANRAYANNMPFMTDTDYDKLWKQLYDIDPTNSVLYHTARDPNLSEGLINHSHPVFGTNKAFNMIDLKPFMTRFGSSNLIIEPKYDGCAAVLSYEKNGLRLVLEGDGIKGLDVSRHLPKLSLPFTPMNFETVEIIIPWKHWNDSLGTNPRNVVAGWLNRKEFPDNYAEIVSHNYGHLTHDYLFDGDYESLSELFLQLYAKWSEIYPIDGLLLKVADEKRRLVSGNNGTTNAWSIAWKPPIQVKETTVQEIEWNVSRLGRVIPTIVYEPIELCKTMNQRATGNNATWLLNHHIRVGSKIVVGKAGEIIPKILEVRNEGSTGSGRGTGSGGRGPGENTDERAQNNPVTAFLAGAGTTVPETGNGPTTARFGPPSVCPKCENPLEWEGVHLVCNGPSCIVQMIQKLDYFYSEKGMDVKDIGKSSMEKLLYDPECFVVLSEKPWALLDSFTYGIYHRLGTVLGHPTAKKIYQNIQGLNQKKNAAHFIAGMGIEKVGYKTAYRLYNYIRYDKLTHQVSKTAQKNFVEGLTMFHQAQNEMKYFAFTDVPPPAQLLYCITGTLSANRSDITALLSRYGWEFSPTVTTKTDFLVVGDSPGKTKLLSAKRFNVEIINEEELNNRVN